jgi:ribonuclease HI
MTYKMYTDGGARGNPGPAGAGVVLLDSTGAVVSTYCKYLGSRTNNEAEYGALLLGMSLARKNNVSKLLCYLDSELVVKQLNGQYKVKNERLLNLHTKVISLSQEFSEITFTHIPRSENSDADLLVNKVLDETLKK